MVWSKVVCSAVIILLVSVIYNEYNVHTTINPTDLLDIDKLLEHYGYKCEIHEVITEDGYILNVHRIPYGKNDINKNVSRIPVLLNHCLACSARDFVSTGPKTSLACILADMGYDVWLINTRGSTWSRKHVKLNPDTDKAFWNFSLTEIGKYDLPATIDYILQKSGHMKIQYIGMSQGTTTFFIMASIKPSYNNKIRLASCLAPCSSLKNAKGPVIRLLKIVLPYYKFISGDEYLDANSFASKSAKFLCRKNTIFYWLCNHFLSNIIGYNDKEVDMDKLTRIYAGIPSGCSKMQLLHFFQWMEDSSDFQQFDFGEKENLIKYGQKSPPIFPLDKVTAPVALYYANNDYIVNKENVLKIIKAFPNVVKHYLIEDEEFNHNDFIFAKNVYKKVYRHVISEMEKH